MEQKGGGVEWRVGGGLGEVKGWSGLERQSMEPQVAQCSGLQHLLHSVLLKHRPRLKPTEPNPIHKTAFFSLLSLNRLSSVAHPLSFPPVSSPNHHHYSGLNEWLNLGIVVSYQSSLQPVIYFLSL